MKKIVLISLFFVLKLNCGGIIDRYELSPITDIENLDILEKIVKGVTSKDAEEVVFVFDLDDTLMINQSACLQTQNEGLYHDFLLNKLEDEGSPLTSRRERVDLYSKIYLAAYKQVRLVDPKFVEIVYELNQKNCKSLILTSTIHWELGIFNPDTPRKEFEKLGIDLKIESFADFRIFQLMQLGVALRPWVTYEKLKFFDGRGENPLYKNGFVFSAYLTRDWWDNKKNKKYLVLMRLFDQLQWWPKTIVWIDDDAGCLMEGWAASRDKHIEFVGLYYSGAGRFLQPFDPAVANVQFEYARRHDFSCWLDDEERLQQLFSRVHLSDAV